MDKKVVLISGASRGIGAAIAIHLASLGYKVIGTARSEFKFDKPSDNLIPLKLDITCRESIKDCAAKLKEQNLLPDILINNAGITSDQLFLRMKDDEWDNVLATNLTGTFNLTKAFIKNMIKNRYGRIINISSISGLMGNPGQVNYSSAKAGLSGFTKSLAKEVGSRNITVNSVAPGFIETDMTSFLDEDSKNTIIKDIPLNRLGSPEDVSELVAFLAGDESQYITGQTISIDGGLFMH
ncbi:3-oxoacyl-[acyl-carrier-protein] reductase [Gammaproteobacteria bacterium]|jgi:3-oxoacyl-[acyl-carrier protein] reductase|nr:3-oxoacyl-[acyl-carrier-protein] reductase [Gammaproteobacteria bacterium]MDA8916347.1 3-oxoacyl-[acyl-carrier-protein] reductase [Gammaproteobacteria bacterium]MDA9041398.1 3-oxoacyl-[acyl-carrier-protein] reductase [Gammaproteobacteria bacterium]MDA9957776.1 3-oxoacyl-[acyl-carrier-protein] reductase [Gammaproteobacteria bacterium]MDB3915712.1 3-oxoacyl-[acyl-carrier-protein] reductase [Gammaproteobacteria bacterium]